MSNNDGCAVARSNEAKALGIGMGSPWFKIKHMVETEGLVALSANFPLCGGLRDRMMSLAASLGPRQEILSIDESFIDLTASAGLAGNRRAWSMKHERKTPGYSTSWEDMAVAQA